MNIPSIKHQYHRASAALLFFVLMLQALLTFYDFFSSPTDENWFRDAPSRFMVVKTFHGERLDSRPATGRQPLVSAPSKDSVYAGDLILTINNGTVKTMKDAYEAMDKGPQNDIRFEVLRPSNNTIYTYKTARSSLKNDFLVLLPHYVYVTDVFAGGASDRGGMKIGDLILRINQEEFASAIEADRILRLGQIGKSLKYEILRNNQFVELNIVLAKFGIQISQLVFALCGAVWMIIGFFIMFSRPNLTAARLTGMAFMFLGFLLAVIFIRRDFFMTTEVLIRQVMIGAAFVFGSAFMFHSMHYFPLERPDLIEKKWIARGYYIASGLSGLLSFLLNSPVPLGLIALFGTIIMITNRKGASQEYKNFNKIIRRTVYVVIFAIIATVFGLNTNFQTYSLGIVGLILLMIPLSFLYTIGRHRLLDINFRIRRNIQYSFATFLWGFAILYMLIWAFFRLPTLDLPPMNIVFTGTAIEINDAAEFASQRGISERVMLMTLAVGLMFVMLRMRKYGQRFIDKKYFRQQYDYRRASSELGEVLATTLSADDLARGLVEKLCELMTLKRAGVLFFRDEQACSCFSAYGFDGSRWTEFCISHELDLITSIGQFRNEFRVDYLPEHIKEEFYREGFQYGIPIRSKEKLIGVILVGEKRSESTFSQEDLAFLATTARQASVAIENSFLYEELAGKERMKHELEIARRIQLESLPQSTPTVHGLDISGTSIPAMEVGGDFFDYLTNGNGKLTVVIGDVSGKGTSAALYMSKVQGILRSLHGFDLSPKELFHRANRLLCKDLEKRSFVTVLGAEFDTAKSSVAVSRAGHLPLLHFDAVTGTVRKVLPRGLGLGLNDASIFMTEMEEKEMQYRPGDVFLFATDGITEAYNVNGDFGEDRLQQLLVTNRASSARRIQTMILEELSSFVGDREQHDDQTIVIVKAV